MQFDHVLGDLTLHQDCNSYMTGNAGAVSGSAEVDRDLMLSIVQLLSGLLSQLLSLTQLLNWM